MIESVSGECEQKSTNEQFLSVIKSIHLPCEKRGKTGAKINITTFSSMPYFLRFSLTSQKERFKKMFFVFF